MFVKILYTSTQLPCHWLHDACMGLVHDCMSQGHEERTATFQQRGYCSCQMGFTLPTEKM